MGIKSSQHTPLVSVPLLIVSLVILLISISMIGSAPISNYSWLGLLSASVIVWLVTYLGVTYSHYRSVYLFSTVYIVCLFMFHLSVPLGSWLGIDLPASWTSGAFSKYIQKASWYVVAALSSFGIGISISISIFKAYNINFQKYSLDIKKTSLAARKIGYSLLLVCIPLAAYAFYSYGNLLSYSRHEIYQSNVDSRGFGAFMMIFPGAVALSFLTAQTKKEKLFSYPLAAFAILLFLFSGYRSYGLFAFFTSVVIWVKTGRKIPVWVSVVAFVGTLIVISFSGHLRTSGPYESMDVSTISESWKHAEIEHSVVTMGQTLGVFAHVIRLVPDVDPYRYGQSYWLALRSAVPNLGVEMWTEKSRSTAGRGFSPEKAIREMAPGDWLTYRILKDQFFLNHGVGFSAVGEPYLNFGLTGVVVFFVLLGIFLGWIDSRNIAASPHVFVFLSVGLWNLMRASRNDLSSFLKPLFFIYIVIFSWLLIRKFIFKKTTLR